MRGPEEHPRNDIPAREVSDRIPATPRDGIRPRSAARSRPAPQGDARRPRTNALPGAPMRRLCWTHGARPDPRRILSAPSGAVAATGCDRSGRNPRAAHLHRQEAVPGDQPPQARTGGHGRRSGNHDCAPPLSGRSAEGPRGSPRPRQGPYHPPGSPRHRRPPSRSRSPPYGRTPPPTAASPTRPRETPACRNRPLTVPQASHPGMGLQHPFRASLPRGGPPAAAVAQSSLVSPFPAPDDGLAPRMFGHGSTFARYLALSVTFAAQSPVYATPRVPVRCALNCGDVLVFVGSDSVRVIRQGRLHAKETRPRSGSTKLYASAGRQSSHRRLRRTLAAAVSHAAGREPAPERGDALGGRAVGEVLGAHAAGRHALRSIVADRRCGTHALFYVSGLEQVLP